MKYTAKIELEIEAESPELAADMVSEMISPALRECGNDDDTHLTDWVYLEHPEGLYDIYD